MYQVTITPPKGEIGSVQVTGTFDDWKQTLPALQNPKEGDAIKVLVDEKKDIAFKFILNGTEWTTSDHYAVVTDEHGNANNVVYAGELTVVEEPSGKKGAAKGEDVDVTQLADGVAGIAIASGGGGAASAAKEASSKEAPSKEASSKEAPSKEAPSKEAPSKEAPSKEAPSKEAPSKEAPSKEAPSKEATKAAEVEPKQAPVESLAPEPKEEVSKAKPQEPEPVEPKKEVTAPAHTETEPSDTFAAVSSPHTSSDFEHLDVKSSSKSDFTNISNDDVEEPAGSAAQKATDDNKLKKLEKPVLVSQPSESTIHAVPETTQAAPAPDAQAQAPPPLSSSSSSTPQAPNKQHIPGSYVQRPAQPERQESGSKRESIFSRIKKLFA
ncbi:uncharacterized protein LODBEIA_P27620 [Lodderomyces beijingensis]|uniref:AMP-activated protein kinase glycogen-binding domain-containing protein n=1 Tax=Lodderomyces beijingensis TaxID=1775926 RepID=A0ABP0ZLL7_9ASCO